ncbi:MAG TPA: ABC transporter substrate-binding protein [Alphaproteobacteria bacterium]
MTDLPITLVSGLYDHLLPLYTGEVKPEGVDLRFEVNEDPRDIFDRMAKGDGFEACEISCSEYMTQIAAGERRFVALPVFPARTFRHGFIAVNKKAGIGSPKDLEGKRVGVSLYTISAAVYIRGLLQHDHGVDLSKIRWVQGSPEHAGQFGDPTVMPLLKDLPIENNQSGKSLNSLLETNEIAAMIGARLPSSLGRHPDVERLFPDYENVERDYYRRTGIFPIMHAVGLRRDIHERHPFVARSLYKAFCAAKDLAMKRLRERGASPYMLPWVRPEIESLTALFGEDFWPYGLQSNRRTLDALMTYLVEQSMIAESLSMKDIFVGEGAV